MKYDGRTDLAGRRNGTRRFLEMNGVHVAVHVGSTISGGRTVSNQTSLPCALEILGDRQLVCVIPVPKRRDLSAFFSTVLLQHHQQHVRSYSQPHIGFNTKKQNLRKIFKYTETEWSKCQKVKLYKEKYP